MDIYINGFNLTVEIVSTGSGPSHSHPGDPVEYNLVQDEELEAFYADGGTDEEVTSEVQDQMPEYKALLKHLDSIEGLR